LPLSIAIASPPSWAIAHLPLPVGCWGSSVDMGQ
jgi:hypothetical protein